MFFTFVLFLQRFYIKNVVKWHRPTHIIKQQIKMTFVSLYNNVDERYRYI